MSCYRASIATLVGFSKRTLNFKCRRLQTNFKLYLYFIFKEPWIHGTGNRTNLSLEIPLTSEAYTGRATHVPVSFFNQTSNLHGFISLNRFCMNLCFRMKIFQNELGVGGRLCRRRQQQLTILQIKRIFNEFLVNISFNYGPQKLLLLENIKNGFSNR